VRIGDIMRATGLTRKALLYYEQEGLIQPASDPTNEYRTYTEADLERLMRITLLRQIGLPVPAIRAVLIQPAAWTEVLTAHLAQVTQSIRQLESTASAIRAVLDLPQADRPAERLEFLRRSLELDAAGREGFMREQLTRLFPGRYGEVLAAHLGFFLDEPLDTEEKRQAWLRMVAYLDETESLPGAAIPADVDPTEIAEALRANAEAILEMRPELIDQMRAHLERQARLRTEQPAVAQVWETAAAERAALREGLAAAGYQENVVANLRILSAKFNRYLANMALLAERLQIGIAKGGA